MLLFAPLMSQSSLFDYARLEAEIEADRQAVGGTSKAAKVVNVSTSATRYTNLTPLPTTISRVWISSMTYP